MLRRAQPKPGSDRRGPRDEEPIVSTPLTLDSFDADPRRTWSRVAESSSGGVVPPGSDRGRLNSPYRDPGANILLVSSTAWPPPSATRVVPLTIEDSSEARNKQQYAISSAVPARRRGTSAVTRT